MHIQEVFNAIYSNHCYEYLIINRDFKVVEYSDKVFSFCDKEILQQKDSDIFVLVPELFGLENDLQDIFEGRLKTHELPYIAKRDSYVNIYLHPGRESETKKKVYETIIVLFEDITKIANAKRQLIQEKNENELLLQEISVKNAQLEQYNNHMQQLVKEEIRKNLEKQKMLELQARYSQMGEIIGMITHQWKQPLNAISMMANVLKLKQKNGLINAKLLNEKLDDILMQVGYMSQTVNDFQHFFNPIKDKIYFNVHDSIQSVLELVKSEYFHKNITVELKGDTSIQVVGLPNELNQVVLSLLKNSKDEFMKHPHDNMRIEINIFAKDDKAVITVTDNAGGIPEDIIDTIFDIYVTTKKDGSGLGLNISKNMIEDHMNGKLYVENVEGGARFTIELPTSMG
jgi:signal transduction histidine kinase